MNGRVPPATTPVASPVHAPLQSTLVLLAIDTDNALGSVITTVSEVEHALLSVTVTV